MALKSTGKVIVKEHQIYEIICDVCKNKIDDLKYPKIEVEITYTQYIADGDQPTSYNICSSECLIKLAKQLKINPT